MALLVLKTRNLVFSAALLAIIQSPAQAESWAPPGHGYAINVGTPQGVAQHSGSPAQIAGAIQLTGDSHGKRNDAGRCHPDPRFKAWSGPDYRGKDRRPCPPLPNLMDQLKEDGLVVQAFFPDATHEVTSAVRLSGTSENIQFTFDSPNLTREDLNLFTIQVTHVDPELQQLQETKAKIDVKIHALEDLIQQLKAKRRPKLEIALAEAMLAPLKALSERMDDRIKNGRTLIAQAALPLQVDNQIAQASSNMSVQGHLRVLLSATLGSAIQGQTTQLKATVTHLPDYPEDDGECAWIFNKKEDQFVSRLAWNGSQVRQLGPQVIKEGESLSFDFTTPVLTPSALNDFTAVAFIWDKKKQKTLYQLANLTLHVPVASDPVAPQWLTDGTPNPDHRYGQNAEPVALTVQDSLGRLDLTSFQASLSGVKIDGSAVQRDVLSQLDVSSAEGGASASLSGELGSLDEGAYTLSLSAKDIAGNLATPHPFERAFNIDRTPPRMELSATGPVYTNADSFDLVLKTTDRSPFTATTSLDGVETAQTTQEVFPVRVPLSEGTHILSFHAKDAAGNQPSQATTATIVRDTIPPSIQLVLARPILTRIQALSLPITVNDSSPIQSEVFLNGVSIQASGERAFTAALTLQEGRNRIEVRSKDLAGNTATAAVLDSVTLDSVPPMVSLGALDHQLLTQSSFLLPVVVSDTGETTTRVLQNGVEIFSTQEQMFSVPSLLKEGLNVFQVLSADQAGNVADPVGLVDIVLDSTPPALANLNPIPGATLTSLEVPVSGQSDEASSGARVNGVTLTLSPDKKSFSGHFLAQTEGDFNLHLEVFDLAGNVSVRDILVKISLKVLNQSLLTVAPNADGTRLIIFGAPGATRPGITVEASAGLLNRGSTQGAADGSFSITLNPFTEATLSATDPVLGKTETATVTYGSASGTLLSGQVRDTGNLPLAGVKVSIAGTDLTAVTDASGVFSFLQPITGDQKLIVDGTTVPAAETGPARKFGKTVVSISIGLSQSNVIERPIFLAPLPLISSPEIQVASGGEVTHPDAPGVVLDIPSNSIQFPDGKPAGQIAVASIPKEVSTVAPPEVAEPARVIALEPSGTRFSQPVGITLPNDLGLAPGVETVVMSMNSSTGAWEIDGTAVVSEDGQSIATKPGQGITHFSLVYMAPLAPVMRAIGSEDRPGADTFNGSVSTTLSLPSYKSLGKDIAPSLIYRSSWAKPSVLLTNLFDIPRQEVHVVQDSSPTETIRHPGALEKKVCVPKKALGFIPAGQSCHYEYEDYYETLQYYVHDEVDSWYEPDYITAQFFAESITGEQLRFDNTPAHPIPSRATLAYGMELKNSATQQYLSSGIYPYRSAYEVHVRGMTIRSRKVTAQSEIRKPQVVVNLEKMVETKAINEAFPSDVNGTIHVQNKTASPAGRGWKIGGAQEIVNPRGERVVLEEADGSIADYAIQNTVSTVFDATDKSIDLTLGVGFGVWPNTQVVSSNDSKVMAANLSSGQVTHLVSTMPTFTGSVTELSGLFEFVPAGCDPLCDLKPLCRRPCEGQVPVIRNAYSTSFTSKTRPIQMVTGETGEIFAIDRSAVLKLDNGTASLLNGSGFKSNGGYIGFNNGEMTTGQFCSLYSLSCGTTQGVSTNGAPVGSGTIPNIGFRNGPRETALFNAPQGIALGPQANTLVVADTGNNAIRLINLATQDVSTLAGNRQNIDSGDGGLAIEAGIFHPTGVASDSIGNLYIASESGRIRKVDLSGRISTIAGGAPNTVFSDTTPASQVSLLKPTGLAIDNIHGYLYVADTGHHRVIRIDFQTLTATTVAGNGSQTERPDEEGLPALQASLSFPTHLGLDDQNNLLVADSMHQKIKRVVFQSTTSGPLAFSPLALDNSRLVRNADGTWVRTYRNGDRAFFDGEGRQVGAQDRVGRESHYSYNTQGYLASMTDPLGRATQYQYVGSQLRSITDPANRTTYFEYGADGTLITARFPDGAERHFAYDANGLMTSETNERNLATRYEYNEWNRLKKVIQPDLSQIEISDAGSQAASNSQQGVMKPMGSSPNSVADVLKDARSVETKFVKDLHGFVSTAVDGEGKVTEIRRDVRGRPTLLIRPDGTEASFTYDPQTGDLLSQKDTATGISTSRTYDEYGNVLTEKNGRGLTTRTTFDNRGLPISIIDPMNREIKATYNSFGQILTQTNPLNKTVQYGYDSTGNVASVTDPLQHSTTYSHDPAGNLIASKDALNRITQYEYDARNRLIAVISAKNERTEYAYLPTGQLSQVKDHLGNLRSYEFDLMGRMTKSTDPLGYVETKKYDATGNVIEEVDPNGNTKAFEYDANSRVLRKTLPDNVYEFSYDSRGKLQSAKNSTSEVLIGYNAAGWPSQIRSHGVGAYSVLPDVNLTFSYDLNGNRTLLGSPVGSTQYSYDNADRLTQIQNPRGEIYTFAYDFGNRLTSIQRPGSRTVLAFDDTNFLNSIVHSSAAGGQPLASYAYARNDAGQRTSVTSSTGTREFRYDALSQLTSATNPEAGSEHQLETFEYDAIQNRTHDQGGDYAYGAKSQRLQEDYRYLYLYDNNGNLTSKQAKGLTGEVTHYTYSSENQLLSIKVYQPGSSSPIREVTYLYDVLGRRIQKEVLDHQAQPADLMRNYTHRFVYDGENLLMQLDASNRLLADFTHRPQAGEQVTDEVLSVHVTAEGASAGVARSAGNYQYLKDGHGSVTDVADANGNRIQHYVYSAFGTLLGIQDAFGAESMANPPLNTGYAFAGREFDSESGLYYNRARYYDPGSGRFLQKDPHPGKLSLPSSVVNSYVYSLNDPIHRLDPTGRFSWFERAIIAVVAVVVAVVAVVLTPFTLGGSAIAGGILVGAIAGAAAGAVTGGIINLVVGRPLTDNMGEAIAIGAIAGGIAGGITAGVAGNSGWGATFKATGDKVANWVLPDMGGGLWEPGLQKPFIDPLCIIPNIMGAVMGSAGGLGGTFVGAETVNAACQGAAWL